MTAPVLVACSGAKSLLDIAATMEHLETLGIPVLGFRTSTLPLFYAAEGGPALGTRVESADAVHSRCPMARASSRAAPLSRNAAPYSP